MNSEKIAVLVDSGTDVPQELIERYKMYVIPLKVIYKEKEYIDKEDITMDEVIERLPQEIPSTSLPDGDTITKIFEQIKSDGYEKVFAVTISSGLSGTYNIVRLLGSQEETMDTYTLDTKNIGIGAGFSAIRAAQLIEEGSTFEELIATMEKLVPKTKVFFNVATLEYLQKGGRIGLVASLLGNALKLNPIMSCNEDGVYYVVAKARGRKKSLDKTLSLVKEFVGSAKKFNLAVAHAAAADEAAQMGKALKEALPSVENIYFGEISPSLVVHTGPGLLGIGVQVLDD
ncbi:MAG: DegV family protein [Enterococcus sp.]